MDFMPFLKTNHHHSDLSSISFTMKLWEFMVLSCATIALICFLKFPHKVLIMKLALMAFASIFVVGHRCVGKETIITRFLEHIPFTFFPHSNVFRCRFLNNSFFTITDISINEYNGDLENLIQNSTAFIYIYSITSKEFVPFT